jgi:mono/diheme cytochrome c family protein
MNKTFSSLACCLCLAAIAVLADVAQAQDDKAGKKLYEQKCLTCHGVKGKGDGPTSASLGKPPTDLALARFWQGDFRKTMTDVVRKGRGFLMPGFPLSDKETKAVIDYMEHTFKK